jgi:hypothetical protein
LRPPCAFSEGVTIPGWTTTSGSGVYGQFEPGPPAKTTYFNSVPDGILVAYINDGTVSQTVGTTPGAGVTYTLTVDIGARKDNPPNAFTGTADLMLGATVCAATGTPPTVAGNWSVYTATCISTEAGDPIVIQLNGPSAQGDFDNVVLTDNLSSTPEPSTLTLFRSGLLALAYLVRRRRFAQS